MFKESEITQPPVDEFGELTTRIRRLIVSFFVDIAHDQPQILDNIRKTCSRMFDQDVSSETMSEDMRAISHEIESTDHWVRDQSCEMGMATRIKIFDAVIHVLNDSGIAIAENTERLSEFGSHLILDEETVTATIARHEV